ncbi:uncharacterized protein PITG_02438 [Phytophthora infestans T30-4]|uniref:Uncharacterized protein n=1 Tax=Phytophthora infestans (strain T30-4) TaxID=403677 RepID=D0MWB5_PHYIT|nr:uncharacterized protein PITG_02438 [Phytophthora infestans T30-4]EEY63928.1 conserved hypothetical protein [Phytophthora infestans T30-4]|eukprot:XP_002907364.1 conserved hypothetical protein [Phytophthora infestans T30-4]
MTDFSRKNGLQSATTDISYSVFMDALTNLRQFGRKFYNADTMDVLNAAIKFIEDFADENEPDRETTKRLLLWINMKLGKFRGLVISDGLAVAILSLTRTLPKQGPLELCLKYLSKTGCNGNGVPGKSFSKYRAHFRPKSLSPEAKTHIETHFGGLAPEFVDL